jgi:cobalt-zinc-cadmium efflux system membrane fusion protein
MSNTPSSTPTAPHRTLAAIAAILALGALAAVLILRSGSQSGPGAEAAHGHGHSEAAGHADGEHHGAAASAHAHDEAHADGEHHEGGGAPAARKSEAGHDEDQGLIVMDAQRMETAGIRLAEAGPATVRSVLQLPGEIRFNEDRTAHVVPRVAGVAESVAANLGQNVKKGQLLAVLSSAAVSEQRSELLAARKRLSLARTTYARERQLWEEKVSAEQDYLQARQALGEAEIAVSNAQQKLAANGAGAAGSGGLNRFELRAPFDGVVVEKHLAVGEAVQDTTQVFTISDLRSVWAEMRVAAPDLPAVRVGEKATVRATAFGSSATGEVAYVGALIGQDTRTAPARITLPNPEGAWRPGLFVNVELTASMQQAALAVASSAIQRMEGQQAVVFVPVPGGFRAQPVRLGRADAKATEVLEGLQPGQPYVAEGSFVLKAELGKASAEHTH